MERGGTEESLLSVVASGSFREKREISGVFGRGEGAAVCREVGGAQPLLWTDRI